MTDTAALSPFTRLEHRIGVSVVALFYLTDKDLERAMQELRAKLETARQMSRETGHETLIALTTYLVDIDAWCNELQALTFMARE